MKQPIVVNSDTAVAGQTTRRIDGRPKQREIWPVPPVPFTDDNRVDFPALDDLVEFYVRAGVDGLFILAYSGEVFELDTEEQLLICRHVVERAAGRIRIVAAGNFGGDLTRQIEQLNRIADLGPEAVVVLLSTLPDESHLVEDLCRMADHVAAPLGVYECPVPKHRLLLPKDVAVLAETGRFVFMKETSRNHNMFRAKIEAAAGSPLRLYQANWGQMALAMDACPGFCGIIANIFPELTDAYCNQVSLSPVGRQALHEILADALAIITQRHYPATMKYVLQRRGVTMGTSSRMPGGQDVDADDAQRLDQSLDMLSLLRPPQELVAALSTASGISKIQGPHRPPDRVRPRPAIGRSDID